MPPELLEASLEMVRRLVVTKQHLAGKLPARATANAILAIVRDVAYVQWDPVTIVAPSHVISIWSRVGDFRISHLEKLLWEEKKLFLHWTPMASLVLTEDYPLYHSLMNRYPESLTKSWGNHRTHARKFLAEHSTLRRKILGELSKGPRQLGQFADHSRTKRKAGEWGFGSDVAQMLHHLVMGGAVMVVGHQGNQNLWGRTEQFLPSWVDKTEVTEEEFEREAAQRALRALGIATPTEIVRHFPRGRYANLRATLADLLRDSVIYRVKVEGWGTRDERYIHSRDVALLESMAGSAWEPRMSLLPPFDNLLYDTARTSQIFDFHYIREQFLPKEKRQFGTYVLPILRGERLIGRIDPRLDKASGELLINAVHAEPNAPAAREVGEEIGETIGRFGAFLGAKQVTYTPRVPPQWRSALR